MLRNIPEEHRSHLRHGGKLKSRSGRLFGRHLLASGFSRVSQLTSMNFLDKYSGIMRQLGHGDFLTKYFPVLHPPVVPPLLAVLSELLTAS
jgi:hypothetical protein